MLKIKQGWYYYQPKRVNLAKIHKNLLASIPKIDDDSISGLETLLNNIISDSQFSEQEVERKILARLPTAINTEVEQAVDTSLNNFQATGGFSVDYNNGKASAAWQEYYTKAAEYKKMPTEINAKKKKDALTEALKLQGRLNTLKGQLFESFIQAVLKSAPEPTNELVQNTVNDLINYVDKSNTPITTQGKQQYNTVITIGEDTVKYSSQGKVDVQGPSPFKKSETMFVSAKNYSQLRDISLLGKGNVLGLLEKWNNATNDDIVYAAQVLSKKGAYSTTGYNLIKKIFSIQALSGSNSQDRANVLITNIKSRKKHPIRVIGVSQLLNKIGEEQAQSQQYFIFNPDPFNAELEEEESAQNYLKNLKLSIKLSKEALKVKFLNALSHQG